MKIEKDLSFSTVCKKQSCLYIEYFSALIHTAGCAGSVSELIFAAVGTGNECRSAELPYC